MRAYLEHFTKSLVDWVFRRRSPALRLVRFGVVCLSLAIGGGWVMEVSYPLEDGLVAIVINSADEPPRLVIYTIVFAGVVLVLVGLIWEIVRYRAEQRILERKKVIAIEARGLRDTTGAPLSESIPSSIVGHRDQLLVDIRQGVTDGEIVEPNAALESLVSLPSNLQQRERGLDRSDLTLVYGGLTPVPITFLTGILLDDEGEIVVFDWDRHAGTWRQLDGLDDGKRFRSSGLASIPDDTSEVALAVSVSYRINSDDIRGQVGELPTVTLDLEDGSPDCHWSEKKQRALGAQFLNTVVGLGNRQVGRIHLFLAAQNSLAFRFGRLYDKRNLPEITVYQYRKAAMPRYPWGVRMPVCGIERPAVVGANT